MNCPNCNSEDVGRVPASGIAEGAMQCQDCKWDSENAAPRPESFMSLQPWSRRNLGDEKFDEAREARAEMDDANASEEAHEGVRYIISQEYATRSALRQMMADYEEQGPGTPDND